MNHDPQIGTVNPKSAVQHLQKKPKPNLSLSSRSILLFLYILCLVSRVMQIENGRELFVRLPQLYFYM